MHIALSTPARGDLAAAAVLVTAAVCLTEVAVAEPGPRPGNFVVHGVSPERAAAIATRAEQVRTAIQSRLFGGGEARAWQPRCELHVHATAAAFTAAVGIPPVAARGATSLEFTGDRVSLRRIDLMGDGARPIPDALDHELVHVVLGDRFTELPPPRWADEGLAVQFDPPDIRRRHEADFRAALAQGQIWSVGDLFALELDPADLGRQRVFYGQSASLVGWLLARGDEAKLLAFVEDAAFDGPAVAVTKHYGFVSLEALERAWRADLQPPP